MTQRENLTVHKLLTSTVYTAALLFAASAAQAQAPEGPVITGGAYAIDSQTTSKALNTRGYSPYAGRNYPTQVFWGDEHVHTGWSVDAGAAGATLSPEDALRFARGEEVVSSTDQPAKLSRPLDWVAITDHSDGAGTIFGIRDGDPQLMKSPQIKKWHDLMAAGEGMQVITEIVQAQSNNKIPPEIKDPTYAKNVWQKNTTIMEKYNEPGRFTAFIGYEWTSNAGGGDNLHRNVIYRDGKALSNRMIPMTTFDSENPEDLWKWMATYEEKTGGSLLAIPHNGNLSNGRMFALRTFEGKPLTREWAKTRALWEPMYEITQIKGTGEAHPSLSPSDEFANFELLDEANMVGVPKKPGMIAAEYAREALKQGLKLEKELGVNPFKFGFAAGTDTHTGLTTAEEDNLFGKISTLEPSPHRWEHIFLDSPQVKVPSWKLSASGWTGVWATENTREAIWDALKRREAYGTTGPRIIVRFFGGFDFTKEDANTRLPAEAGYAKGIPMGGDLSDAPEGKAPTFLVAALKDALSGNLDRIQIIKGWMDAQGELHEKVYDVVWSDADKRQLDSNGKLPPVGNTVNVADATWTNSIGDPELITVWKDPDFDARLKAFYYARVIEIPTPRWTAYDAKKFNQKLPNDIPMFLQERAYTSPIWYTP